ncbi:MAG TPA: site-specific DNA-methyltransferase [Planctomycetaceae bacterium]|nr:site-specific DNA-methyltransferase [Planctomycetaceae bacterium]
MSHPAGKIISPTNGVWYKVKKRAPRNRTLTCEEREREQLASNLITLGGETSVATLCGRIVNQDFFTAVGFLPAGFVDLLILDPPYNLSKDYNGQPFHEKSDSGYREWFRNVVLQLRPILAADATVYVCSDWKTSILVAPVLQEFFQVRNRITWEREKGRGAKSNWKNNTEDIWYCTLSDSYVFNVDAVKLKRKVVAPYRDANGKPKDWQEGDDGNYRLTYPSNIWTDITIPFWSMPENTDHPTQKPEKLIAKLILSSSNEGDFVFDPFLGSGTTAVVAKKLHRHFSGIEQSVEYCCWAQKRLSLADADSNIQGYSDGTFWERNTLSDQKQTKMVRPSQTMRLFDE